jgi:hypothetical protein
VRYLPDDLEGEDLDDVDSLGRRIAELHTDEVLGPRSGIPPSRYQQRVQQ